MTAQKKSLQGSLIAIALLSASVLPAMAEVPTPHIYNRGLHGQVDLTDVDGVLTNCPGLRFSQVYLGNSDVQASHFLRDRIVPGGKFGRDDIARFEKCANQSRQ
ncbi:MAG: hypothetical protein GC184_11450 [Rhizobiales bacterium]|nr:hypothetical protein [Hyphomicrobiales bacterium]